MENEFVPYELAVKLKEFGFDVPVLAWYNNQKELVYENRYVYKGYVSAPLWQQAFDWMLEKHDLFHQLEIGYGWEGVIRRNITSQIVWSDGTYNTPQEVRKACLEKLIELVAPK